MSKTKRIKSLKGKFNEKFLDWVTSSSSHGLPNVFRTHNILIRIMWIVVILGSFSYCSYSIVRSIIQYTKYETTVSISRVQEIPAVFPAITLCSLNAFDEDSAEDMLWLFNNAIENVSCWNSFEFDKKYCVGADLKRNQTCLDNTELMNACVKGQGFRISQVKAFIANFVTDDLFLKSRLGYLYGQLFFGCSFKQGDCGEQDFTRFWSNEYGNCYTFNANSSGARETIQKGFNNAGLVMHVHVKTSPKFRVEFPDKRGLYLIVHNQSSIASTLNNGIFIPTGFTSFIGVDRVFNSKLPGPYSNCIDDFKSDNPYTQRLFGFFRDLNISYYDQDVCYNLCQQDKLVDACNCTDLVTKTIRNAQYCMTYDQIYTCMYEFYNTNLTQIYKEYCNDACPPKCTKMEFNLQVTSANYATLSNMKTLRANVLPTLPDDEESLIRFGQQSVLTLKINYLSNYYTLIEDKPAMTIETLLGNVGGQLGLFIGISFLSLVEIIEFGITAAQIWISHRRVQNTPQPSNQPIFWTPQY